MHIRFLAILLGTLLMFAGVSVQAQTTEQMSTQPSVDGSIFDADQPQALGMYYTQTRHLDTVFTAAMLNNQDTAALLLYNIPEEQPCTPRCVRRSYLKLRLHMGGEQGEYTRAKASYSAEVTVRVTAMNGNSSVPSSFPSTPLCTLKLLSNGTTIIAPEQQYIHDFTSDHPFHCGGTSDAIERLKIEILNPTSLPADTTGIRLEVSLVEEVAVGARKESYACGSEGSFLVRPSLFVPGVETTNPLVVRWENVSPCLLDSFPNYQIQILRLFNTDEQYRDNGYRIRAVVDWNRALTLETYGPAQELTLTMCEGTGFYVWRVRPIGDMYSNGIGNDSNWGCWSKAPQQGDTLYAIAYNGGTAVQSYSDNGYFGYPVTFFYHQFNDSLNWIFNRTFTEGKESRPGISESMIFANALLQPRQQQAHLFTADTVLAGATVYDFSGRPSLNTMAAPVADTLGYVPELATHNNGSSIKLYAAEHFDGNGNYRNPALMNGGAISRYYSNLNPDKTIPSADSLPFSRILHYPDASGRAKEQGGLGKTLGIGGGHTTRIYYSSVNEKELVSVFGDEAPSSTSATRVITVDPNDVASVQYYGKEGKVLATCLAKRKYPNPLHMELGTDDTVNTPIYYDTLRTNKRGNDYEVVASIQKAFLDTTDVRLNYSILPATWSADCPDICLSCDYRIIRRVRRTLPNAATVYQDTILVPARDCFTVGGFSQPETIVTLPPGEYYFERVIQTNTQLANNSNPVQFTSKTQLEQRIDGVRSYYNTQIVSVMNSIFGTDQLARYYNDPQKDEMLYDSLLKNYVAYYNSLGPEKHLQLDECCGVTLPASPCRSGCNPLINFEKFLYDSWQDSLDGSGPGVLGRGLSYYFRYEVNGSVLNKYPPISPFANDTGAFNAMIAHMIADGYDCEELWRCWEGLVANYKNLAYKRDNQGNLIRRKEFDLLETFLSCTGKRYCGVSSAPYGQTTSGGYPVYGYLEYAYRSFQNNTTATGDSCRSKLGYVAPGQPGDSLWRCDVFPDSTVNAHYLMLYNCFHAGDFQSRLTELTQGRTTATVVSDCGPNLSPGQAYDTTCINRMRQRMIDSCNSGCEQRRYEFRRELIQAYLKNGYSVEGESEAPTPPLKYITISLASINCAVDALVEKCKEGSSLTMFTHQDQYGRTVVDSVGSQQEAEAFQKSMFYPFKITLPESGVCPPGSERVGAAGSWGEIVIDSLNNALTRFRDTTTREITQWNYYSYWKMLQGLYPDLMNCSDSSKFVVPVSKYILSQFVLKQENGYDNMGNPITICKIYYRPPATLSGYNSSNPHPIVKYLNNFLDSMWARPVPLSSINATDSCSTEWLNPTDYYTWYQGSWSYQSQWKECYDSVARKFIYCDAMFPCVDGKTKEARKVLKLDFMASDFFRLHPSDQNVLLTGTIGIAVGGTELAFDLTVDECKTGDLRSIKYIEIENSSATEVSYPTTSGAQELTDLVGYPFTQAIGLFHYDEKGDVVFHSKITGQDIKINLNLSCYTCNDSLTYVCDAPCGSSDCGNICFTWTEPENVVPEFTFAPKSCARQAVDYLVQYLEGELYGDCINNAIDSVTAHYTNTCANPAFINDKFVISYQEQGLYHYTLYYYDRAGNLVKTIPPKGVRFLRDPNINRSQHPNHTFVTTYEYTSLKQLIRQKTPDGGTINFWYNSLGQLRLSQNAKQALQNPVAYSYTEYDALGRVAEVGEITGIMAPLPGALVDGALTGTRTQQIYTVYSTKPTPVVRYQPGHREQRYLQNRVSYTYTADGVYTYYSYDPHGNVEWLVQKIPGMDSSYVRYEYDLISGKVTQLVMQEGKADRFYHRYSYDADNRILGAETSRDGWIWERDARYNYYVHGPLRRVELGTDKLQGIDYVYTLAGWLKAINHPSLDSTRDVGGDGLLSSRYGKDAFGMALGYFPGDFNRYNGATPENFTSGPSTAAAYNLNGSPLYNGNITSWTSNIEKPVPATGKQLEQLTAYTYRYDLLNRLREAEFHPYQNGSWPADGDYQTAYQYDPNGNMTYLRRWGRVATPLNINAQRKMDEFGSYVYDSGTNRLRSFSESSAHTSYTEDIDAYLMGANNYTYDATGNLTGDALENIPTNGVKWNIRGKVTEVEKTTPGLKLKFLYDAQGNRVRKEKWTGAGYATLSESTWYLRDAQGNVLGTYEKTGSDPILLTEAPIYGSERIGMALPAVERTTAMADTLGLFTRYVHRKQYELKDHLGNVRVTLSDFKESLPGGGFRAYMMSYANYYPFGMLHPNRSWNRTGDSYRYGFNGMEKDNEIKGEGNSYTTLYRNNDPRLGRWLSVDPKATAWESPYVLMKNSPVWMIDPWGDTSAIYDRDGEFINFENDGSSLWSGRVVDYDFDLQKTVTLFSFKFNDIRSDRSILEERLVFISRNDINGVMQRNGVHSDEAQKSPWKYIERESRPEGDESLLSGKSEGRLDHVKSESYFWGGIIYSSRLHVVLPTLEGDGVGMAYNDFDFGNFLWGQAGKQLGFSLFTLSNAAQLNHMVNGRSDNPDKVGPLDLRDDPADQRAIEAGHYYPASPPPIRFNIDIKR